MPVRERRIDRARYLAGRALARVGDELREGRLTAGLTQAEVGAVVGISRSQVSRIERGLLPGVAYVTLVLMSATVGLDLPLRTYPGAEPVRDAVQLALLAR
jgi:transcriptional regulator with XRE-family HTH domain